MAAAGVSGLMDGKAAGEAAKPALQRSHAAAAPHGREKFLPVTRHALLDRLTAPALWPNGDHAQARRFLRYLDYWRRHGYAVKLLDLEQVYEPFSPDTDLLRTREYSAAERLASSSWRSSVSSLPCARQPCAPRLSQLSNASRL